MHKSLFPFISSFPIIEISEQLRNQTKLFIVFTQNNTQDNTMDSVEDAAVQDFLEILEEHRKNCERQGKYVEAEIAKNRLEELKLHEENRRRVRTPILFLRLLYSNFFS